MRQPSISEPGLKRRSRLPQPLSCTPPSRRLRSCGEPHWWSDMQRRLTLFSLCLRHRHQVPCGMPNHPQAMNHKTIIKDDVHVRFDYILAAEADANCRNLHVRSPCQDLSYTSGAAISPPEPVTQGSQCKLRLHSRFGGVALFVLGRLR
jgi:hypothetical protein